jgi:serine/threonine protein kinase
VTTNVLPPGAVIDRYVVDRLLGRGGMAEVYLVHHADLGSVHALKVLSRFGGSTQDRLLMEGRTQAQLQHPNVVAVTDVVRVDGAPGLILEYVGGPNLGELIDRHTLTLGQLDELATGMLKGVAAAHDRGWIHRDLKPANVLCQVTDEGLVPKVADFGLVKAITGDVPAGAGTKTGTLMGTPSHMAPEQIRDSKSVDHRADIFALGTILYRMVAGEPAFSAVDSIDVFMLVLAGDFVPVRERAPEAPERMVAAITAAMQLDPDDRPQSCRELLGIWNGQAAGSASPDTWGQGTLAALKQGHAAPPNRSISSGELSSPTWSAGELVVHDEATPTLPPDRDTGPTTEPGVTLSPGELAPPSLAPRPTPPEVAPPPATDRRGWVIGGVLLLMAAAALVGLGVWLAGQTGPPAGTPASVAPAPAVVAPADHPKPESTPAPAPAPEPVVAVEPEPEVAPASAAPDRPRPEPSPPTSGADVSVQGADRIWLVSAEGRFPAGRVPAGAYVLHAVFDGGDPEQMGRVTLTDGETRIIRCEAGLRVCR